MKVLSLFDGKYEVCSDGTVWSNVGERKQMIEKLDPIKHTDNLYDRNGFITNVACGGVVISKVNELVEAVNVLQAQVAILEEHAHPTAKTEPAENPTISKMENVDPYAEQRKWVGKLCRFWDYDGEGKCFNILKEIGNPNTIQVWRNGAFRTSNGYWYKHCEPVKPDDDIIYKGGDK